MEKAKRKAKLLAVDVDKLTEMADTADVLGGQWLSIPNHDFHEILQEKIWEATKAQKDSTPVPQSPKDIQAAPIHKRRQPVRSMELEDLMTISRKPVAFGDDTLVKARNAKRATCDTLRVGHEMALPLDSLKNASEMCERMKFGSAQDLRLILKLSKKEASARLDESTDLNIQELQHYRPSPACLFAHIAHQTRPWFQEAVASYKSNLYPEIIEELLLAVPRKNGSVEQWPRPASPDELVWLRKTLDTKDASEYDDLTTRQKAVLLQHCILTAPLCEIGSNPLVLFRGQKDAEPFNGSAQETQDILKRPSSRILSTSMWSEVARQSFARGGVLFIYLVEPGTPFLILENPAEMEVLLPTGILLELVSDTGDAAHPVTQLRTLTFKVKPIVRRTVDVVD